MVIVLITLILISLFFFRTSEPIIVKTNFTSPLYTYKYANITYPDEILTPGEIGTNDLNVICYEYYEKLLVKVPDDITKKVYEEYMIKTYTPKEYEIDHFIPLALGGSNNIKNLWPQPITYPGYKEKDYLQLYLRDQVCNHGMNLTDARMKITGDWYSLYLKIRESD